MHEKEKEILETEANSKIDSRLAALEKYKKVKYFWIMKMIIYFFNIFCLGEEPAQDLNSIDLFLLKCWYFWLSKYFLS